MVMMRREDWGAALPYSGRMLSLMEETPRATMSALLRAAEAHLNCLVRVHRLEEMEAVCVC
jgi:hypothetical protein